MALCLPLAPLSPPLPGHLTLPYDCIFRWTHNILLNTRTFMAKVCLSFEASCYDHFDVCVFVDVSVARMLDKCVLLVCVCPAEYDWACVCVRV